MHQSKLFGLLATLSPAEIKRFHTFVASPYFNQHARTLQLMDLIAAVFPDLSHASLHRERVFHALYPDQEFREQKIYELGSYLQRLLRQFLVQQELEAREFDRHLLLLRQFRRRGLDSFFQRYMRQSQNALHERAEQDEHYLLCRYLLSAEASLFFSSRDVERKRTRDTFLQDKTDFLEYHYLAGRFKSNCEMLNRESLIAAGYDLEGLSETVAYYEQHADRFAEVPAVRHYYLILKTLLESDDESHFTALTALLEQDAQKFSHAEAQAMYAYAQNYCIKKINEGRTDYFQQLFRLYLQLLDSELLFTEGRLSQWDYKNIVTAGLRLEKYDWTRAFIDDYRDRLAPELRANAHAYNRATWSYAVGRGGEALRLLQQVELNDASYQLGTRSLMTMIYYERDELQAFFSTIDAFKSYLHRNKLISERQRKLHQKFLRLASRLYKLRLRSMASRSKQLHTDIEKFRKQVGEATEVANIVWLRRMVREW